MQMQQLFVGLSINQLVALTFSLILSHFYTASITSLILMIIVLLQLNINPKYLDYLFVILACVCFHQAWEEQNILYCFGFFWVLSGLFEKDLRYRYAVALWVVVEMAIYTILQGSLEFRCQTCIMIATICVIILKQLLAQNQHPKEELQSTPAQHVDLQSNNQSLISSKRVSCQLALEDCTFILRELPIGLIYKNVKSAHQLERIANKTILEDESVEYIKTLLKKCLTQKSTDNLANYPQASKQQILKFLSNSKNLQVDDNVLEIQEDAIDLIIDQQRNKRCSLISSEIQEKLRLCYLDHKSNKSRYIQFLVYQQQDDNIIILIQDITDKMRVLDQKQQYKFENQLLNSFSHELRTPLNGSQQLLQTLNQKVDQNLKETFVIPLINQNALLMHQINDILDYAALGSDSFQVHRMQMNLRDTLCYVQKLYTSSASQKGLSILLDMKVNQLIIVNDVQRIIQVLVNLLNNSIKFTKFNGKIKISALEKVKLGVKLIKIIVEDNGVGLGPEDVNTLNQYLTGVYSSEETIKSKVMRIGLGLKVSNRLVNSLIETKGLINRLKLKSQINEWTRMSFFIEDLLDNTIEQIESDFGEKKHNTMLLSLSCVDYKFMSNKTLKCKCNPILIVDDIPFNHQALIVMLKEYNCQVDQAFDGVEAVERVQKKMQLTCHPYYQLILMDIEMPRMNGFEASKQIKSLIKPSILPTKIVMCSAYDSSEFRKQAQQHLMDDVLPKPIQKSQLKDLLQKYLTDSTLTQKTFNNFK